MKGRNCLVAGFGYCGRAMAKLLLSLEAEVTAYDIKEDCQRVAMEMGCSLWQENAEEQNFEWIFHMADKPCTIDTVLKWCDEKTYLWDIITGGGLPAEELEEKGIHVEHLTAVPGRILTESAGIILARMIERGAADYGRV